MNTSSSSEDDFVVDVDYLPMGRTGQARTDIFRTQREPVNEFKQNRYKYSDGLGNANDQHTCSSKKLNKPCADPESFFRVGPNLTMSFFLFRLLFVCFFS